MESGLQDFFFFSCPQNAGIPFYPIQEYTKPLKNKHVLNKITCQDGHEKEKLCHFLKAIKLVNEL